MLTGEHRERESQRLETERKHLEGRARVERAMALTFAVPEFKLFVSFPDVKPKRGDVIQDCIGDCWAVENDLATPEGYGYRIWVKAISTTEMNNRIFTASSITLFQWDRDAEEFILRAL